MAATNKRRDGRDTPFAQQVVIDLEGGQVTVKHTQGTTVHAMDTQEAFSAVSEAWLRCGWDNKHVYGFTWLGRPIIQLPDDLVRLQEVIYLVKPDVIIETGVAHGGSLVFSASLCKVLGRGRVVGVDIEIRPHNRAAIEAHALSSFITLIEGDSVDPVIVDEVKAQVQPGERVLVLLDSGHSRDHVLSELDAYGPLVTEGSYMVAMDGIMEQLAGAPRTEPDWTWNNPKTAALEFVESNPSFAIEEPAFPFNEGNVADRVTYWPCGFIKKFG